jgi:hypothetical protein
MDRTPRPSNERQEVSTHLEPTRESPASIVEIIDAILDKGLVINADIAVSVAGVELLGIKIRATLASFETAARYGLEFPSGCNLEAPAWREALIPRDACPQCHNQGCPWCGWLSARAALSREPARYAP